MPSKCCVIGCKSNLSREKVSMFRYPREERLRREWDQLIHRNTFAITDKSLVCELHFKAEDIRRTIPVYEPQSGRIICTAPLDRPRLRTGAVPCKIPELPRVYWKLKPEAVPYVLHQVPKYWYSVKYKKDLMVQHEVQEDRKEKNENSGRLDDPGLKSNSQDVAIESLDKAMTLRDDIKMEIKEEPEIEVKVHLEENPISDIGQQNEIVYVSSDCVKLSKVDECEIDPKVEVKAEPCWHEETTVKCELENTFTSAAEVMNESNVRCTEGGTM